MLTINRIVGSDNDHIIKLGSLADGTLNKAQAAHVLTEIAGHIPIDIIRRTHKSGDRPEL